MPPPVALEVALDAAVMLYVPAAVVTERLTTNSPSMVSPPTADALLNVT